MHPGRFLSFQAAYALAKEFVEITRGNRQKMHTLHERDTLIKGLIQHPPVEIEPTQLPLKNKWGCFSTKPFGAGRGDVACGIETPVPRRRRKIYYPQ